MLLLYSIHNLSSNVSRTPDHLVFIISASKRLPAITRIKRLVITETLKAFPSLYIYHTPLAFAKKTTVH